ncbi:hypothetical protein C5Y96_23980 [Blastopirellula marina]|uniref:Type II secretion system protein GspC N-terminal domain-containing protein n=1 Tax=Blastopirellula marina TaxID=124 RepID=A0A2S8EZR9_9BACT|nr:MULTISPECIES: hypothetical protein [Pirellulaceae]PQO25403.1 hypothetical protein C5Y96_23980 [Blastopirellula marina]RCS42367.1 hypothetical protein DTL36_24030 [Bremerella cremea]
MNSLARYHLAAIAVGALLLGSCGCGFSPVAPSMESPSQASMTVPDAPSAVSKAPSNTSATVATSETTAVNQHESKQTYRNPFRPPSITTRTLLPQQAESGEIRLLGIAKRDSQHIALLETSGDLHKAVVGDFINDWEVLSVNESETTLRRGLEQMSLRIR